MSTQRIKDASFLQQHIEKLILAAGLLVFAVAVFLFVMGNPFAVQVNNQTYPEPAEAVDVLVRVDDQLEQGLQAPNPLPEIITPEFSADFLAMMNVPVDLDRIARGLSDPGLTTGGLYPDIPDPARYALVFPPAPKNITHVSGTDVLDKEFDPRIAAAFFKLWGKEMDEPGDFTMFVAAGEFDIWEWITRLQADPQVEGDIKIPTGIWAQRFGIAGVALLREEWDPVEDRWTNRQIVVPMPGQDRVLPDDKAETETTLAIAKLTELRDGQLELAQPELPWLTDFVQVTPPGSDDDNADGFLQLLDEENLGKAEKEIRKLEEKIKELQERQAKRREREGAGGGRPGGGGPGGDFDSPRPERRDPIAQQIANLQEKITRLQPQAIKEEENRRRIKEAQRKREEERLRREALRGERDRALGIPENDPLGGAGIPGMEIKEGATLRVWAADPSMQPGKTYRYKLLVSVINPLYAVPRLAPDQLEENRERAALLPTEAEIDAMPWIGPIKVEPKSRFFFTSGGDSRARIEIYRRHNGELITQEFDATPGDQIGGIIEIENEFGQPEEIDMRVDAVLVDVEKRRDLLTNTTAYALIYTDSQGNIYERTDAFDKSSPELKDLRQELKDGPEQALRPDPDAEPGDADFGPGNFDPSFDGF